MCISQQIRYKGRRWAILSWCWRHVYPQPVKRSSICSHDEFELCIPQLRGSEVIFGSAAAPLFSALSISRSIFSTKINPEMTPHSLFLWVSYGVSLEVIIWTKSEPLDFFGIVFNIVLCSTGIYREYIVLERVCSKELGKTYVKKQKLRYWWNDNAYQLHSMGSSLFHFAPWFIAWSLLSRLCLKFPFACVANVLKQENI